VHRGQISDANQRAFYRRWAEMMEARGWADIPLAKATQPEVAAVAS
jgi:ethylbenzene dioxygenase alpha subunit